MVSINVCLKLEFSYFLSYRVGALCSKWLGIELMVVKYWYFFVGFFCYCVFSEDHNTSMTGDMFS